MGLACCDHNGREVARSSPSRPPAAAPRHARGMAEKRKAPAENGCEPAQLAHASTPSLEPAVPAQHDGNGAAVLSTPGVPNTKPSSCTCGRCVDGWLSPNLAGQLCAAAEMERWVAGWECRAGRAMLCSARQSGVRIGAQL